MDQLAIEGVAATNGSLSPSTAAGRPTRALPWVHLLNLSIYWLGINVLWSGLGNVIYPARYSAMFGAANAPGYVGLMQLTVIVAILAQPTFALVSDFTVSRWGRRKPYIVIGALLDVVFLYGIASGNTFIAIFVFAALLQFSSSVAQGPFQGYVPDLVPARQVGVASGLMGVMIVLGNVLGVGIASLGLGSLDTLRVAAGSTYVEGAGVAAALAQQAFFMPTVGLALIEVVTMVPLVLFINDGRVAPPRGGRSWLSIALGAWGTDILREHSYIWLLCSRLFFLMAPALLTGLGLFYLNQSLGQSYTEAQGSLTVIAAVVGVITGLTTFPAARMSDRIGRKRTIYLAIVLGMVSMTIIALAPSFLLTVVGLVPFGVSMGAFLAVDWALMTDIIPKATTGRYMGISNVATGLAGPLGLVTGGALLSFVVLSGLPPELRSLAVPPAEQSTFYALGPRIAYLLTLAFFAISALTLTRVDETRRED